MLNGKTGANATGHTHGQAAVGGRDEILPWLAGQVPSAARPRRVMVMCEGDQPGPDAIMCVLESTDATLSAVLADGLGGFVYGADWTICFLAKQPGFQCGLRHGSGGCQCELIPE